MLEILYPIYKLWNKGPIIQDDGIKRRYTIVYIHGAGHCGSTLLNLLLNAHSEIIGLSEISTLHKSFMKKRPSTETTEISNTTFWKSVLTDFERRLGIPLLLDENRFKLLEWSEYFSLDQHEINRLHNINRAFFDSIDGQIDSSIICDASKFLVRLHMLISSGLPVKVIHLDRNGRGIMQSYLRKGNTFKNAFIRWSMSETGLLLLSHWLPKKDLHYCQYEKLARNPEKELRKICRFLGTGYEKEMITNFRNVENLGINGNRMRNSKDTKIFVDNSWKELLPLKVRLKYWFSGGWIHWPIRLWLIIKRK